MALAALAGVVRGITVPVVLLLECIAAAPMLRHTWRLVSWRVLAPLLVFSLER